MLNAWVWIAQAGSKCPYSMEPGRCKHPKEDIRFNLPDGDTSYFHFEPTCRGCGAVFDELPLRCDRANHHPAPEGEHCQCGRTAVLEHDSTPRVPCQHHIVVDACVICGYLPPQDGSLSEVPANAIPTGRFIARLEVMASKSNGPLSRIRKIPWLGGMFYKCWQLLQAGRTLNCTINCWGSTNTFE
jgi:hypothetical protein